MDNVQLYTESEDALQFIVSVGIPSLAGLVFLILGVIGGTELAARVRATAVKVRKYVDEPTDLVVVTLEGIGEFVFHKDMDPADLSRILMAVTDALAKKEAIPVPSQAATTTVTITAPPPAVIEALEAIPALEQWTTTMPPQDAVK